MAARLIDRRRVLTRAAAAAAATIAAPALVRAQTSTLKITTWGGKWGPQGRLKAMPDTYICVPCSERTGGEFELEVNLNSTGKAGSLKKTGEEVQITRKRKKLK